MLVLAILTTVMVYAACEPPISNTYLPPPRRDGDGTKYPPEVTVARSRGTYSSGSKHNGGRIHNGGYYGQQNPQSFRNQMTTRGKSFGYPGNIPNGNLRSNGPESYNVGGHLGSQLGYPGAEFGPQGTTDTRAEGEYHVALPDGRIQTVSYEADERGFKPKISYGEADTEFGGYDRNAASTLGGRSGFTGHSSVGTSFRDSNGGMTIGYHGKGYANNNGGGYDSNNGGRNHGNRLRNKNGGGFIRNRFESTNGGGYHGNEIRRDDYGHGNTATKNSGY